MSLDSGRAEPQRSETADCTSGVRLHVMRHYIDIHNQFKVSGSRHDAVNHLVLVGGSSRYQLEQKIFLVVAQ
jgi:hypothetical protein